MESIILSSSSYISREGKLVDIFLTERAVMKKHNVSILLRMIHLMDPDIPSIKILRESLLMYVHMSDIEDLRQLEWRFSWKLLNSLAKLRRATGVDSKNLLHILAMLNNEHQNKYTMGSINIFNLVTNWQAQTMVREAKLTKSGHSVGVKEFLEQRMQEFLANQDLGPVAEADPVVDDPEVFQVDEPVLQPGFKLYPAHQPALPYPALISMEGGRTPQGLIN